MRERHAFTAHVSRLAAAVVLVLALTALASSNPAQAGGATFNVNINLDAPDNNPGDGFCDKGSFLCTLRAAVMEANALPESGLRPGTCQSLAVVIGRLRNVTLVPESALLPLPEGGHAVFTVADGLTRSAAVRRLVVRDGIAAVEGLNPGTAVVLSTYLGWNRLSEGEPVRSHGSSTRSQA